MTEEKVLEVIRIYRKRLEELDIPKVEAQLSFRLLTPVTGGANTSISLSHCHNMLDTMEELVKDARMGKAFRWLGFIQGCFWVNGIYSIEEMANHNRPAEGEKSE